MAIISPSSSSKTTDLFKDGENKQDSTRALPKLDQAMLFKQLKPLTVPIIGMLPIKNPAHSLQLLPIIASIKAIVLNHSQAELMTPPMIHYIFFPIEQIYHQVNLVALSESCLNQVLELSSLLVRAAKLHEPNALWTSKETLIINCILPLLIQNTGSDQSNEEKKPELWKPARSDESTSLALDLITAILYPHCPNESRPLLNLDNLYQNQTNIPSLSAYLLRFLFQHLVDILDTLYRIYASPKQSQPSLDRARNTIRLIRLGLLRLSSSNISAGNGVDILSTFLPSITSKLTQLACLLAQRRQSSELLSLILHTIEWLLVECLDDELPDLQEILADRQFHPVDCEPVPDQHSQSDVYDQVLEIASDWKLGRSHSTPTPAQAVTKPSPPASSHDTDSKEILVKRDQSWLRMTSAKVSIVLQRLSPFLENHSSPIVREAWAHFCSRLIERTSLVLRISSSCSTEKNEDQCDPREKDGFGVVLEALISLRSNQNFDVAHDMICSSLANVTRSAPLASVQVIVQFIRANFHSLSNLLVKQASGQDHDIIHLSSRITSSLDMIIDIMLHQTHPTHFYQSCFNFVDLNEFQNLLTSTLCRVHLVIPKILDYQPDQAFPSGNSSLLDHPRRQSKSHQRSPEPLPSTFPSLSVKNIFDHKSIKALEELVRAISRLVLHLSYLTSWSSIKISEIVYLDQLLQLTSTTKGAKPSDVQQSCLQLNALWALGESIRASKSISTDDRYRARFGKIEIFCLQGLEKLLEISESYRVEGGQTTEEANHLSSEMTTINQALDNLTVTSYLKGNDQLLELERLKPTTLSRGSDELIANENFQALRTSLILRLIASLAYVFEGSFQTNLSWVLYYVLAQLGSPNPYVYQHAMATVSELAFYCGYASIANMLEDNSDYLTHMVSNKLLPHQYDIQAPFVLEHLIRLVGLRAMLPLVEQILLHDFFELLDDYHGYDLMCEQITGVFRCVMSLMNKEIAFEQAQRKVDAPTGGDNGATNPENTCKSDNRIDEIFEIEQQLASVRRALAGPPTDMSTDLERFKTLQAARAKWRDFRRAPPVSPPEKNPQRPFGEIDEHASVAESVPDGNEKECPPPPLTGYQRIAAELMSKSANFLTHSSTNVRLNVSLLINDAIPILGSTSLNPHESSLLPVIQRFWTIILSRLDDDRTAIETLNLLQSLCQHVGAFMSRRLVNEIWPRIRRLIESTETPGRVRQAAIDALAAIVSSADHINWKEDFVWEIIQSLFTLQARSKSKSIQAVDRILDRLSDKGFRGSVLVARRAALGLIVGMEFMAPKSD
ncbi:hypothetical protein PtA15_5A456 [Puccinia triticina]|uniref:Uncharacterized protein n=1 Tax=Puccinia triticina TaxID=208348 RepID=A0ABY7CKK2_9BASI|nr:uncharacterized protein PtA15_5A456 [Puccinia triticina]WAQ84883.1 hypothetical protein PtA15_5A456 [Puccinia triticina]